jgi:hypothetical protein
MTITSEEMMKGKKTDPAFVARFISECAQEGVDTPDEIVNRAKRLIEDIDIEIKAIETKKLLRSKLLDVIVTFEKPSKDKTEDSRLLSFFKLRDPERCREVCDLIKMHESIPVLSWAAFADGAAQFNFCIKQLLEAKIITRAKDQLIRGERFDEYMKFVLREDK